MKIYLLTIRLAVIGAGASVTTAFRYTDSYWVQKSSAEDRAKDVREEFSARGYSSEAAKVWMTEGTLTDGALAK